MRSPFARFTVLFILCVLIALGAYLFFTGRLPVAHPQPAYSSAPVQPEQPTPAPQPAPAAQPQPLDAPPDIAGLNYPEVAVPGADLPIPTPPVKALNQPGDYVSELAARKLVPPIEGLKSKDFTDTFRDARAGGAPHEATDIMAARGTPVHAVAEGNLVKLFTSKKGGLTIYQFDDAQKYCFYYAHLDRYAPGVKEGMLVRPGDVIGFVGATGDASQNAPHLHFAISLLDPDKKYWKGAALNPYPVLQNIVQPR